MLFLSTCMHPCCSCPHVCVHPCCSCPHVCMHVVPVHMYASMCLCISQLLCPCLRMYTPCTNIDPPPVHTHKHTYRQVNSAQEIGKVPGEAQGCKSSRNILLSHAHTHPSYTPPHTHIMTTFQEASKHATYWLT